MAAFGKVKLFVPPNIQCRFRGKWHSKRPDYHKTIEKKVFEDVTRSILPQDLVTDPRESCSRFGLKAEDLVAEENKYEEFLVRKFRKVLKENKMIICCQHLAFNHLQFRHMRFDFLDHGVDLYEEENDVVRKAIEGTKWRNLAPLVETRFRNVYALSRESRVAQFIKVSKNLPLLEPMAGFVEDRLVSRDRLMEIAKLPGLDVMRGETLSVLESNQAQTTQLLTHHQQTLSLYLQQFIKDNSASTPESTPNDS